MEDQDERRPRDWRSAAARIVAACAMAVGLGVGAYWLLEIVRPRSGLLGLSFLFILPAVICALISYLWDIWGDRPLKSYLLIPLWVWGIATVIGLFVLREGVICILMLAPLWLVSGALGAAATYKFRRLIRDSRKYCMALMIAPLLAMQLEPMIPVPETTMQVSRSIVVEASPEHIWPLLRGIPDVRPGEGRWNVSQDLIGVPRPLGARLIGEGIGAERLASWDRNIHFRERIVEWRLHRRIGWEFSFDDISAWKFTDRHLTPDSAYLRVTRGGYSLQPVDAGHTRVTLDTRYWMKTPVNVYSALWGELILGDLENNLLALIKQRAERAVRIDRPSSASILPSRGESVACGGKTGAGSRMEGAAFGV